MKDNEKRMAFIEARAEGKSYGAIAQELQISKSTCVQWGKEFDEEIATLKDAQRAEQIEAYKKQKEARIKGLNATLEKIDKAIEEVDFSELNAKELLNLKLNYTRALKEECPEPVEVIEDNTLQGIISQYNVLFAEAGRMSPADLKVRLEVLRGKHALYEEYARAIDSERHSPLDYDFPMVGLSYNDIMIRGLSPKDVPTDVDEA